MVCELRTYRVQVNERSYTVSVEQTGKEKFKATVGDEAFETEPVSSDEVSAWVVRSGDDAFHAQVKFLHNDKVDVWLAGVPFPASVQLVGVAGYAFAPEMPAGKGVGGVVRALMPGRITSILVKEGEAVEAGSPLLILEAMKMQNEIASPIAGRVKSVQVQEGATVKKDSVLVVVE